MRQPSPAVNGAGPFDLSGRTALVTGSGRGIGRAIALGLAERGASVAVHCPSRADEAAETAHAIEAAGVRSATLVADLRNVDACRSLIPEAARRVGPVDILVLNASTEIRSDWLEIAETDFDIQVVVNLKSSLLLLQAAVPGMAERGWGRVVAIGSIQEAKPNPHLVVYAALKAAQTNMMVNLARQYAKRGVTFNSIAPGAIATERNAAVLSDPAYRARVEEQIPSHRIGSPHDCIGAALLLCSDAGAYITGGTIFVDGGWHVA
jgi:glucose 1-dehydrogenase